MTVFTTPQRLFYCHRISYHFQSSSTLPSRTLPPVTLIDAQLFDYSWSTVVKNTTHCYTDGYQTNNKHTCIRPSLSPTAATSRAGEGSMHVIAALSGTWLLNVCTRLYSVEVRVDVRMKTWRQNSKKSESHLREKLITPEIKANTGSRSKSHGKKQQNVP